MHIGNMHSTGFLQERVRRSDLDADLDNGQLSPKAERVIACCLCAVNYRRGRQWGRTAEVFIHGEVVLARAHAARSVAVTRCSDRTCSRKPMRVVVRDQGAQAHNQTATTHRQAEQSWAIEQQARQTPSMPSSAQDWLRGFETLQRFGRTAGVGEAIGAVAVHARISCSVAALPAAVPHIASGACATTCLRVRGRG